eukprot:97739-Chlamydomonas_euryale.AAC.1
MSRKHALTSHRAACRPPPLQAFGAGSGTSAGGTAAVPLPTLSQNLRRPVSAMWAPLLVDVHNAPAAPQYELQQAVQLAQPCHAPCVTTAAPAAGAPPRVASPRASSPVAPPAPAMLRSLLLPKQADVAAGGSITRWAPAVATVRETAPMEPPFELPELLTQVWGAGCEGARVGHRV